MLINITAARVMQSIENKHGSKHVNRILAALLQCMHPRPRTYVPGQSSAKLYTIICDFITCLDNYKVWCNTSKSLSCSTQFQQVSCTGIYSRLLGIITIIWRFYLQLWGLLLDRSSSRSHHVVIVYNTVHLQNTDIESDAYTITSGIVTSSNYHLIISCRS